MRSLLNARRRATGALAALGLVLTACGSGDPPAVTYVLGPPPSMHASVEPLIGRPAVEVKPVLLPDYLDVSDLMVRRSDNVVAPSSTGRWGERLSVGVTRALTLDLQQRLPSADVTSIAPLHRAALQVLVEVEAFEPRAEGAVVLMARWQVVDAASGGLLAGERVSLTEQSMGNSDAAMAAGMSRAVDEFATPVAAAVRAALQRRGAAVG